MKLENIEVTNSKWQDIPQMKSFFTGTNFSFESVEVLLCALEIHEFQVMKSGNTDGVSRKIPSLQFLLLNNTFWRILATLNTESHFRLSTFGFFAEILAFSKKRPWVNIVNNNIEFHQNMNKVKRKWLSFYKKTDSKQR